MRQRGLCVTLLALPSKMWKSASVAWPVADLLTHSAQPTAHALDLKITLSLPQVSLFWCTPPLSHTQTRHLTAWQAIKTNQSCCQVTEPAPAATGAGQGQKIEICRFSHLSSAPPCSFGGGQSRRSASAYCTILAGMGCCNHWGGRPVAALGSIQTRGSI